MSPQPPKGYILIPEEKKDFVEPPKGYILEPYKDPISKASEKVAPAAGRIGVEALPFAGSFLGPGGTLVGTGISQMMKRAKPEIFGEQPQGMDAAANAGKELILNNLLPSVLGKLGGLALKTDMQGIGPTIASKLSNFPAVREGAVKQITQQLNKRVFPESGIIEQGGENAKAIFGDSPHLFSQNKIGQRLANMQDEFTNLATDPVRTQEYNEIKNMMFKDKIHVQNAKLVAGPEFTNDLAVNKLLTGGGNPAEGTIDAARVLKELGGKNKEIYQEAMNPASYDSMKGLLETMAGLEKKNITDTVLSFSNRRLLWNVAGGAGLGTLFGHPLEGAAAGIAAEAPVITNMMLTKIMKNPETAKLVTLALTTPAKAPQAGILNKALTEILPRLIQGEADIAAAPSR